MDLYYAYKNRLHDDPGVESIKRPASAPTDRGFGKAWKEPHVVYYIYGLHAGDGKIRYIGYTNNPTNRFSGHKSYARTAEESTPFLEWLRSGTLEMVILETCEELPRVAERVVSQRYIAQGADLFSSAHKKRKRRRVEPSPAEQKGNATSVAGGRYGAHLRWHVARHMSNSKCAYCNSTNSTNSTNRDEPLIKPVQAITTPIPKSIQPGTKEYSYTGCTPVWLQRAKDRGLLTWVEVEATTPTTTTTTTGPALPGLSWYTPES
ncbi:hypothetical protein SEA_SIXAMA_199 [Gordonia phage Sixama]|uniref:GIY-YIG domain-containing protein n=1 Tax=Gordonia phage Sixama TaxID=2653271 RepID=A0A5Q2F1E5_9CAUD|nr:hypothetical protein PP302_gp002 [Gordonia phage Sixama]YP_010648879.1 hypothetical protein PP302_gp130 [Gordonia phage Sixama]QGF20181.1 hypothetical protein SEA_SIXAMA_2 [Gordonia phage Sixama]QGF20349.1 hypothetical protein SEA_SIXAMA_199 [Gordonia phage Sixama]